MQFHPPSQPGWDQSEPDPLNSRVQQQHPPQPTFYPPQQPGQYFQQQTQYPSFPPSQRPSYPPEQLQHWQQLPVTPLPPQKAPKKPINKKLGIGCGAAVVVLVLIIAIAVAAQVSTNNSTATNFSTPTAQSTNQPTSAPTQIVHYPPTTQADLRGLAAQGDASAIHVFHRESVGLTGICPQPKIEATVDSSLTGQQLAKDLLAYFYGQQLDNPCGSLLLVYHNQSEANDVYTAGRISFDATDSSGSENTDPNATNLTYTLTLDIGGVLTGEQEYIINY